MICTSIQNKDKNQILEALAGCEMAEIRLDRCPLSQSDIEEIFSSDVPLIATCRIAEVGEDSEVKAMNVAEKRLLMAIEAGARYVDVEIEAPKQMSKRVRNAAHECGTVFIRSYHDFKGTDSLEGLKAMVEKCRYHGADVVKLVTTAEDSADVEKVMSLYDWWSDCPLVAFCMGEEGRSSRLDCLRRGAPYTYAALTLEEATAPGQWTTSQMKEEIYSDFAFVSSEVLDMPVSKSFAQRAVIAAALAEGVSHLRGYSSCGDNESALEVARKLGAEVSLDGNILTIKGIGASLGSLGSFDELHVGESGLLTRMMLPLMTQLSESSVKMTGEKTLLGRPLTGAREIMETFGAQVDSEDVCRIPLSVKGPLKAGRGEISGSHGSQMISGLLMALPFSERNSSVIVRQPKSIPYIFITLEVLKKFGIRIGNEMLGGPDFLQSDGDWSLCTEMVFKIKGGQKYKACDMDLEGDWSAAANFLVAGAVFGSVEIAGLDTTSLQADLSIMDILMDAGASLSQIDGDKGNIVAQRAPLSAFNVDASNCPDLFPIVAVLASFCQGKSRVAGVGRLANKESDRAKAIVQMLTQMGVDVQIEGDEMVIKGHSLVQRLLDREVGLLRGGHYTSHHDHRMVMALKVASYGAESPIVIDDEDCVAKSFPTFHNTMALIKR